VWKAVSCCGVPRRFLSFKNIAFIPCCFSRGGCGEGRQQHHFTHKLKTSPRILWQNPVLPKGFVSKRRFSASHGTEEVFVVPSALRNVAFVGGRCFLAGLRGKVPGQGLCVEVGVLNRCCVLGSRCSQQLPVTLGEEPRGHRHFPGQLVLRGAGQPRCGHATSPGEVLCDSWRGSGSGTGCRGFRRLLGMVGPTRPFVSLGVGPALTTELFIFSS